MERAEETTLHHCGFRFPRGSAGALPIDLNERIQFGIKFLDLREMRLQQFNWGNCFLPDKFGHGVGRKKCDIVHKTSEHSRLPASARARGPG